MRKLGYALLFAVLICAALFYAFLEGMHIQRVTPDALEAMLSPHYEIYRPEGQAPFPTVIGYHGCSGTLHGARDWAKHLNQAGYAVVLVESMIPREVPWRDVCAGKALWGSERAGDVMVSLDAIRRLPFVDANALHLFGWSHGGWSLMDTFEYAGSDTRPPNLTEMPTEPLRGVKSATLFYPFCEFPVRGRHGWPQAFPVHFVFAQTDSIVSNEACQLVIERQQARGKPISSTVYPNTDHAFDMRDEDFYDCCLKQQPEATAAAYEDVLNNLDAWSQR